MPHEFNKDLVHLSRLNRQLNTVFYDWLFLSCTKLLILNMNLDKIIIDTQISYFYVFPILFQRCL